MIKNIISSAISLSMMTGCIGNVINASAESGNTRYYLRSDYAVSTEGVISDNTKVDSSTGDPQIDIEEGTTAKIVVNTTDLSAMSSAVINYAQSGGTLDIKLTALENAEDETGVELANTTISAESGYDTRNSDPIAFINTPPESAEYMKVELSVSGSKDGKSYINYVELSDEVIKIPAVVVWRSISNGNVLDIEGSGTANGDIVTASAAEDSKTSQHWTIQETDEKGWNIIVNKNSGKGMGLLAGTTAPGAEAVQWTIDGSANQLWRFVKVEKDGNTYYKILNKNSKLVLTVNNNTVTQEEYTGSDNQLWEASLIAGEMDFVSNYDDNYAITNVSASAENNVISYNTAFSKQDGMYFEIT